LFYYRIYHYIAVRVGLVINPISGMGGAVGLKGTDSPAVLAEAIRRGARPMAPERAAMALQGAGDLAPYEFFTAGGAMGEDVLRARTNKVTVIYAPSESTSDQDTRDACAALLKVGIDLLLFAGGDGTARDVMDAVGEQVPVIGIPSGVKMHSGVFANTPRDAGILLDRVRIEALPSHRTEVMDLDEEEFRQGTISASLYGYMLTPEEPRLMQPFKMALGGGSEEDHKEAIAAYFVENMRPGVLYILGPGTTIEVVGRKLGIAKTLLGVDLVVAGRLLRKDVDEDAILSALNVYPEARIVVSPIGAQGFIFGRGNQQISSRVIEKTGIRNVVILATPFKMQETKTLHVDTGSIELDEALRGYGKVLIGYGKQLIAPIA
jgi:predicted polyphosphate/ATP-dependent NAD kinase